VKQKRTEKEQERNLAFESLYGLQFTLSTLLIKTNYLVITLEHKRARGSREREIELGASSPDSFPTDRFALRHSRV